MKKSYEMEIKWRAGHVKRHEFLEFMTQQIKKAGTTKWGYLTVFGPDFYWKTDNSWVDGVMKTAFEAAELEAVIGKDSAEKKAKIAIEAFKKNMPVSVIRNRVSDDLNELTAKARLGERHITVRQEENVRIDQSKVKQKDIDNLMLLIGMKRAVTIKKDCDIYTIEMEDGAKIDVVWYQTFVKGFEDQVFIEVEVSEVPEEQALQVLNQWKNQLRYHLKLTDDLISNDSLYEIFTGETYKKV